MAVDHVLPWVLMTREWQDGDLHQVWNLVLACYACNPAKRDRLPAADRMPWLEQRDEHLYATPGLAYFAAAAPPTVALSRLAMRIPRSVSWSASATRRRVTPAPAVT